MLIDNKKSRYQSIGVNIKTVWDFISKFAGTDSQKEGGFDIVTGYFTIRALSMLYREIPEKDVFRIVSSELIKEDRTEDHIIDLLNGNLDVETATSLDQYAEDAKAFLRRNSVHVRAITEAFCHAKAYIFSNKDSVDRSFYLSGSSNLTDAGLGLKYAPNVELNNGEACDKTNNDYQEICSWFEDIWEDARETIPIDPANPKAGKISVKDYFIKKSTSISASIPLRKSTTRFYLRCSMPISKWMTVLNIEKICLSCRRALFGTLLYGKNGLLPEGKRRGQGLHPANGKAVAAFCVNKKDMLLLTSSVSDERYVKALDVDTLGIHEHSARAIQSFAKQEQNW